MRYQLKHPEKILARGALRTAIEKEELKKENCQECGSGKSQAHHYKGYAKENWLVVQWLCNYHHRLIH